MLGICKVTVTEEAKRNYLTPQPFAGIAINVVVIGDDNTTRNISETVATVFYAGGTSYDRKLPDNALCSRWPVSSTECRTRGRTLEGR